MTFLNRPLVRETDFSIHQLHLNPEALLFRSTDSGATEFEYLQIIAALVGIFKPTALMETGTWNGDGAACLLEAAAPGSTVISICHHALDEPVRIGLEELAQRSGSKIELVEANTIDLVEGRYSKSWGDIAGGSVTFAFLDSSIPDRATEFAYISDERNGVMDFARPLCVCVHDMSEYRHPDDADTGHLPEAVRRIEATSAERGWRVLRLNQSRGMLILIKYPDSAQPPAQHEHTQVARINLATQHMSIKVLSNGCGDFTKLTDENILIYFPHGFGDWVFLSRIMPLLEPSNRYWVTRFGDDSVSLMEGSSTCNPIYLGVRSAHTGDGDDFGIRHFGIDFHSGTGDPQQITVPDSLRAACSRNEIQTLFFSSFPESWGGSEYPFHTKARYSLKTLVPPTRLDEFDLTVPLESCVNFDMKGWAAEYVESRLRSVAGFGERKLCIIGRTGYTSLGKNWAHEWRENEDGTTLPEGHECREFMRLMLKKDRDWLFLIMEDRLFEGADTMRSRALHCYSYAELFGTPDDHGLPFGIVMRVLANLASLSVGVPAGAHHLCMAKPELPSVGLWIDHFPSWYDEPKEASIHLLSRNIRDRGLDRRPGSFTSRGNLTYRTMSIQTRRIYGEDVISAVEALGL